MSLEIKKNPKADLMQYRSLIFGFSLALSLCLVIMAFEWKSYDKDVADILNRSVNSFEILNEVPLTEIQPPPPAAITQPTFIEVPNEEEIVEEVKVNIDIEMNQDTRLEEIKLRPVIEAMEEEETETIFTIVETPAEPIGGLKEFYKYVGERIKYPAQASRMAIEGKVFVEFIVNKDGSLADFKVVKGIGLGCDEEAMRVLETSPKWKPAKQRGNPVRQRMVIPIHFILADRH